MEAVSEEGKADSRFSMRGREEAEKKVREISIRLDSLIQEKLSSI